MRRKPSVSVETSRSWVLRRLDQAAMGAVVFTFLIALAGYWLAHGGASGNLIEIDRASHRSVKFLVDVNQAEWPELAQLPDVGETLARRIVDSRQEAGPFLDHDDLRRVRGIGPKTLERLRPYLRPMPAAGDVAAR